MKLKPHKTYLCINSEIPIVTKAKNYLERLIKKVDK